MIAKTEWRPFEQTRENIEAARRELERNHCNRHDDCEAADRRMQELRGRTADHCHDECCEECFGY